MKKFIHEIKLPESDEFSKRFNRVSDLFSIAQKENTKEAWDEYISTKYCLEQGLPIAFPNEQGENELLQLRQWKKEAMLVMPDFQEIGELLKIPLGQSIHDKIIPGIKKLIEANEQWGGKVK